MKNPVVWRSLVVVGACLPFVGAQHAAHLQSAPPGPALTPEDSAFHALNRLAYGPRPGDVPRVVAEGVMRWIDRQLSPDGIDDDHWAQRERRFDILKYDRGDLAALYAEAQRERRGGKLAAVAASVVVLSLANPGVQRGLALAGEVTRFAHV